MKLSTRSLTLGAALSLSLAAGACGADHVTISGSTTSGAGTTGAGAAGGAAASNTSGHGGAGTSSTGGTGGAGGQGGAGAGGGGGGSFPTGTPAAARIASGGAHNCVILADTTVRCWGYNEYGQLGDGSMTDSPVPVTVTGLSGATSLDAGGDHTCAVLADATVRCWGKNGNFELGDGTQVDSAVPVTVKGLTGVVALALGTSYEVAAWGHSCAILAGGAVRCWGSDQSGELGDGTLNDSAVPVAPVGLGPAVAISSYGPGVYVALADGTLWDWGGGGIPQPVAGGIVDAVSVSAGLVFACTLLSDGTPRCWGHNFEGQLGQGGLPGSHPDTQTPVVVAGVHHAVAIGSGSDHTCAVLEDKTLRCWGWNIDGQLGGGNMLINPPLVEPVGVHGVVGVAGGAGHTCALLEDGTVRCWGANGNGQLGDGTTTDSLAAVEPVGL